jgi:aspartyl protease family protein
MDRYDPYAPDRAGGSTLAWAMRHLLIWAAAIGAIYLAIGYGMQQLRPSPSRAVSTTAPTSPAIGNTSGSSQTAVAVQGDAPTVLRGGSAIGTLSYHADSRGHFWIEAVVNGTPMRFLLDTGASFVALTTHDAQAAGFAKYQLEYSGRTNTANGQARVAPVTLRQIRIGQLAIDDVPAVVGENLNVSLLGMTFLKRLQSYEIRDGVLTITW